MLKCFLAILVAVACSFGGVHYAQSDLSIVFIIGAVGGYIAALYFLISSVIRFIRETILGFTNVHRQVRQSIDDERIRKFHEYGKGGNNGL